MSLDIEIPNDLYFLHRLNMTAQATVPGSVAFDLARSPAPNDQLDQTAQLFGTGQQPVSSHENGWGLSSFVTHLASTQPDAVKAPDLTAMQEKLKAAGYLPPGYAASGAWDSTSEAALGQWERQQTNDFYAGKHMGATTTQKALNALGWMMPSQVFQGVVGAAKGFVQQTPETVERVGALGGAAAGAAIGGSIGLAFGGIGAVPGAAVGAIAGAAIGFFGDLLHHDDSEGNQSGLQALWDSMTPYDEYKGEGGFGRFMEDVGWTATAAALVSGVGSGVQAGIAGAGEIAAGADAAGTSFWSQAIAGGANQEVGWSSKLISRVASIGNADRGAQMLDFFKARGLMAQAARPIISDVIQPVYTGLSSAQMVPRFVANLGQGEDTSTITKAIDETAPLKTGIEVPLLGDIVDLPAFVINPSQWLPWRVGDVTRAITRGVEADPSIEAIVNVVRADDPTLTNAAAHSQVAKTLGDTPAEVESRLSMLRTEYGVEAHAYQEAVNRGFSTDSREEFMRAMDGIKDELRDQVHYELGTAGGHELVTGAAQEYKAARSEAVQSIGKPSLLKSLEPPAAAPSDMPTLRKIMSYSANDQAGFQAYMQRLTNNGSGIDGLRNYFSASDITRDYTNGVRDGALVPLGTDGKVMAPGVNTEGSRYDIASAQKNVDALKQQVDALQKQTDAFTYQPAEVEQNMAAIEAGKSKLKEAEALLKQLKKQRPASWDDRTIVAERADTPTKWDYLGMSRRYGEITDALTVARDNGNIAAYTQLKQMHLSFLQEHQDILPAAMLERAKEASKPIDEIPAFLEKQAKHAPEEVIFSDPTASAIVPINSAQNVAGVQEQLHGLGYKAVVRHYKNTFEYSVDPKILEVTGVNDYSARHTFYESIGMGVTPHSDRAIAQLRSLAMVKNVDQLSQEKGWGASGETIMGRLYRSLNQANSKAVVTNEGARALVPAGEMKDAIVRGGFVTGEKGGLRHFAVDVRDLRPDDVYTALGDIPGFTHEDAGKVFQALQNGGSFGSELHFLRNPLASANELGRVLRISGFQGFTDIARQWHLEAPAETLRGIGAQYAKRAAIGAGVGGTLGFIYGDDKFHDSLRGAEVGLATGLGVAALAKRSYGFLPDYLYKVTMALRYSLSPSFDVRRFVKQNLLAAETHDLPPVMNGPRYIKAKSWKSIYKDGGAEVTGDEAWGEAKRLWGEINGVGYNEALDSFDRSLYASGILGYNPMNRQMAHAYMLAARGASKAQIKTALKDIYSYGAGRSAMEKSINYIFFPFSFEKKLLTTTGDFLLQAPARALLLHEGMKRWYDSTWAVDVQDFLKDHAPLLSQMQEFNAFSHGISPGRFLFQGADDHRSSVGRATQLLASFFVPGGAAATPIHQAIGGLGDVAQSVFHPVAVTGESLSRMGVDLSGSNQSAAQIFQDIGGKYIPLIKDVNELWTNATDQVEALRHGEAPWSQVRDYYDSLGGERSQLNSFAAAFGYSDYKGLLGSGQPIANLLGQGYEATKYELSKKYPDAANMAATWEDTGSIVDRAKQDILHSQDTSAAYEGIRQIIASEQTWKYLAAQVGDSPQLAQLYDRQSAQQIRALAMQHQGDPRFDELWSQLFQPTYGPISIPEVA